MRPQGELKRDASLIGDDFSARLKNSYLISTQSQHAVTLMKPFLMPAITTANVTVAVKEIEKSIEFYKSIGLTLKQRWEDYYAQVASPGVVIGLHPGRGEKDNQGAVSIGFGVDKLDEIRETLTALKVPFRTTEDKSGNFISFSDPDGTPLYFMQSKVGDW